MAVDGQPLSEAATLSDVGHLVREPIGEPVRLAVATATGDTVCATVVWMSVRPPDGVRTGVVALVATMALLIQAGDGPIVRAAHVLLDGPFGGSKLMGPTTIVCYLLFFALAPTGGPGRGGRSPSRCSSARSRWRAGSCSGRGRTARATGRRTSTP